MSVARDTKGKTLPARAYMSPEVYEAEMREVFLKSWNFACHVSDVAEPGTFWTTSIAGEPIAVLRDHDGKLRALSNVCRHRAARILTGAGQLPEGAALPLPRLDVPARTASWRRCPRRAASTTSTARACGCRRSASASSPGWCSSA